MLSANQQRQMLVEEISLLSAEIKKMGYWVEGSRGQDILNPALGARRSCLESLRKLDATHPEPESTELDEFLEEESESEEEN